MKSSSFLCFIFIFLLLHRTELKKKISGDYSCAFGSVGGVLEFWNGNQLRFVCALLCKLKPSVCCWKKLCYRSFAVTRGFFWTCLLRNMVAIFGPFFWFIWHISYMQSNVTLNKP